MRMSILSSKIKEKINVFILLIYFLSFHCFIASADEAVTEMPVLGIVISLDCPNCKNVFEKRKFLYQICMVGSSNQRCEVRFLPFIESKNDYRADVFYAISKIDEDASLKFLEAIYALRIERTISVDELVSLVSGYIDSGLDLNQIIRSASERERVEVKKVGNIITKYSILDYPTFLLFKNDGVKVGSPTVDPNKRLELAFRWIEDELE